MFVGSLNKNFYLKALYRRTAASVILQTTVGIKPSQLFMGHVNILLNYFPLNIEDTSKVLNFRCDTVKGHYKILFRRKMSMNKTFCIQILREGEH